jgi:hypothetical protein
MKNRLLLILLVILVSPVKKIIAQERAAWMGAAKFGVMTHYLQDWLSQTENLAIDVDKWNDLVNHFDTDRLAESVKATGAGYLIFTIGQNSGYYVSPNKVYDRMVGRDTSRCAKRDLIADLGNSLHKLGLKFIVYLPSGAPARDDKAKANLQWKNGPYPNIAFQQKWEQIISDWSVRWGNKVDGWWFDGCYWPNMMYRSENSPNFKSFAGAARAGNPNSCVGFNCGEIPRLLSLTPYEDYTAGEESRPELLSIIRSQEGKVDGSQIHVLSYLGQKWGMGSPRYSNEEAISFSKVLLDAGGAITWDVPIQSNGEIYPPFLIQLTAIGKVVAEYKLQNK